MDKGVKALIFFLCLLLCAYPAKALQDYEVGNVRVQSFPTHTQIVFDKAAETSCLTPWELTVPSRLLVDLSPAFFITSQGRVKVGYEQEIPVEDSFVQRVSVRQESESVVKVVVYLAISEYTYNVSSQDPESLVIDIRGPRESPEKDLVVELLREIESTSPPPPLPSKQKEKVVKIVLDPGHGGDDPGAIGRTTGLEEANVVLAVAKELALLLEKEPGIEVYLTREDDRFLYLDQRTEIANQIDADIFVSIHANAAPSRTASGVETFVNSRYAEGIGAEDVARRENRPPESEDTSWEVEAILWDMIQDKHRNKSNDLSHSIQKRLSEATGLEDRGVKYAPFYVLRGADMPAALVEIGFLSNVWDESKLKKDDFRKKIAQGILEGVKDYLKKVELKT